MQDTSAEIVCLSCGETLHHATELVRGMVEEIDELQARLSFMEEQSDRGDGPFIASRRRRKFHRLHCVWAENLNQWNAIEFQTHAEAVEAGYKPCGTCCA